MASAFLFNRDGDTGVWSARESLAAKPIASHASLFELRRAVLASMGTDVFRCGPLHFTMVDAVRAVFVVSQAQAASPAGANKGVPAAPVAKAVAAAITKPHVKDESSDDEPGFGGLFD
jgi:hypothetical protein